MAIDWKHYSQLLVGVLSLAVAIFAIYISMPGAPAQGLTMSLISSYALQPGGDSQIRDLQVTLNGAKIDNPYVSTLTLKNTGSKPILSADFETPIVVSIDSNAKLITAQIIKTTPKGIKVELELDSGKVKIPKFLSNPSDEIAFATVTSGMPQFATEGRIAGVSTILYEDLTEPKVRSLAAIMASVVLALCSGLYTFYLFRGRRVFDRVVIGPWVRIPTVFCLTICGFQALQLISLQLPSMTMLAAGLSLLSIVLGAGTALISVRAANRDIR